ncbi:unnamed protein product [Discula destructiva]
MASRLSSILLGALAAIPAINAASATTPRDAEPNPGFLAFPIKRGERSSKTLSGRQVSASLINEQETSYTIQLTFGSNAQPVQVAIDTGSDELFVDPNCNDNALPSSEAQQCVAEGSYDPSTSTSANATGETSTITYGSGAVAIEYFIDSVGVPGASKNLTAVQFGKATESQDLSEGILGLGFGDNVNLNYSNFVDALQEQGVTNTKAFSVALGTSATAGGNIVFGGVDTKKFSGSLAALPIAAPALRDIQRYAVSMASLGYVNSSGSHTYANSALEGVVLDTGSSLCELPADIVDAMAADVGAQQTRSGLYLMDCAAATSSQKFEFAFAGMTIAVPLNQFVLEDGNACALGVQALQADSGITALLGDSFLRNAYVVFDQANMQISLAQYSECGTNVQAIAAGTDGVSKLTGECAASADASNSSSSSGSGSGAPGASKPAAPAVFALVAGLVALMGLV